MKCDRKNCRYCMDLDTYAHLDFAPYTDTCFLPPGGKDKEVIDEFFREEKACLIFYIFF